MNKYLDIFIVIVWYMFNIKQKKVYSEQYNDLTDRQGKTKRYLKKLDHVCLKAVDLVIYFVQLTKWLKLYSVCRV